MPPVAFAESLLAAYPEAKVILTTRDVDAWYKSMMSTIIPAMHSLSFKTLSYIDPDGMGLWISMLTKLLEGFFEQKPFEEIGKKKFVEHYEKVRRLVPKQNLLDYKIGEGWGRLCEFLGQPIPEQEFPNTNDTKAFGDRIEVIVKRSLLRVLKIAVPVVGALGAAGVALYFFRG